MHLKPLVHLKSGLHRNPISSEHQQTYLVWVEIFLISSHQRLISLGEKEKAKPQESAGHVGLKFYYLNSYLNQPSGIKKDVSILLLPWKHSLEDLEDTWVSEPHREQFG